MNAPISGNIQNAQDSSKGIENRSSRTGKKMIAGNEMLGAVHHDRFPLEQ